MPLEFERQLESIITGTQLNKLKGCTMLLNIPMDSAVVPDARVFLTHLSHLPVEVQIDMLRDATSQITAMVEQAMAGQ